MLKDNIPDVTLTTGDVEIGAVEIKNDSTDDRAKVQAASSTVDTTVALAVADGNLHTSLGAVGAAADPDGVLHGQLRSIAENTDALPAALGAAAAAACLPVALSTEDAAKVPSLGAAAAAASVPVTLSTEDAAKVPSLGAAAAAASVPVALSTEDAAKMPSLGVAASAASVPVVLASDDAHLGAVGAAADPDGVMHGQLRSIAENTDALPAALGSAADAASLPVTQSTEDKAVLAAMSAKLPASLGSKAAAASLSVTQATEDAARMPASLGSKADAASFPVTQSTEDKAVLAAMSAKLPATLGSKADAASLAVTQSTEDKAVLAAMSAKLPASLGIKAAASSLSVTQATEDAARMPASLGSKADAASFPVTMSTEDKAKVPALGVAASAASSPVVLASDDAHLGAVGAAADADGVLHAQLYYLAGKLDQLDKLEARIAQPNMLVAPSSIAIDTTTARVTGLTVGTAYMVYTSAPCFIEVGADNVEAATTNTYIEPGMVFVWTPTADNTDDGLAAIGSVAGGKVYVQACQA